MKIKEAFDRFFEGVRFDNTLYKKLLHNNIEFITRDQEHTQLFSGRNIGCYFIKYTMYDKNIFYDTLFGVSYDDVTEAVDEITTINPKFKIAKDDINLVTFYIAHRFLSNEDLTEKQQLEFAKETLNYFNYRTLVLLSPKYFVYPISEARATSLVERLSNKYIIKKVKNWNDYCQYRSDEYLSGKFAELLKKFTDDEAVPNAISDLYGRTNDTIKNIFGEFDLMMSNDDIIRTKTSIAHDGEGADSIVDRIDSADAYAAKIETLLSDKTAMIRSDHIHVVVDILPNLSYNMLSESLGYFLQYAYSGREGYNEVSKFLKDILSNAIDYLQKNDIFLNKKTNVIDIMNSLVGNVLYARGNETDIQRLKIDGEKLIKKIYKLNKDSLTDRNVKSVRNGMYLYVVLRALTA